MRSRFEPIHPLEENSYCFPALSSSITFPSRLFQNKVESIIEGLRACKKSASFQLSFRVPGVIFRETIAWGFCSETRAMLHFFP